MTETKDMTAEEKAKAVILDAMEAKGVVNGTVRVRLHLALLETGISDALRSAYERGAESMEAARAIRALPLSDRAPETEGE